MSSTPEAFEPVHASDIQLAQSRISSEIAPTPLQYCPRLSQELSLIHISEPTRPY